jgi:hypothetical protein
VRTLFPVALQAVVRPSLAKCPGSALWPLCPGVVDALEHAMPPVDLLPSGWGRAVRRTSTPRHYAPQMPGTATF